MSALVIITSLIAFMILIINEKMLIFIERIREPEGTHVDIIADWYISKVVIGLSEYW